MFSSLYSAFGGWTGPIDGNSPQKHSGSVHAAKQQHEGAAPQQQPVLQASTAAAEAQPTHGSQQLAAEDSEEVRTTYQGIKNPNYMKDSFADYLAGSWLLSCISCPHSQRYMAHVSATHSFDKNQSAAQEAVLN